MAKTTPDEKKVTTAPPRDPLKAVGLDTPVAGEYRYLDDAELAASGAFESYQDAEGKTQVAHARTIAVGGQHYEHTGEDADGVWIYRQM